MLFYLRKTFLFGCFICRYIWNKVPLTGMMDARKWLCIFSQKLRYTEDVAQPNQYRNEFKTLQSRQHKAGEHVIVAVDLGSTYSGYAYATTDTVETIQLNAEWTTEYNTATRKTPSFILTQKGDPTNLIEYGYNAYTTYSRSPNAADNYSLYQNVKGALFKPYSGSDKSLTDDEISDSVLQDVLITNLRYFKEHVRHYLFGNWESDEDMGIKWIVTVPNEKDAIAILKDAATKAGMKDTRFVHESLAAATWCQQCPLSKVSYEGDNRIAAREKYIVINAGGSSTRVATFQKTELGDLLEIEIGEPMFQNWNHIFQQMFEEAFGEKLVSKFKTEYPQDWVYLWSKFELIKRTYDSEEVGDKYDIALPSQFVEFVEKESGKHISDLLKTEESFEQKNEFWYNKGQLCVSGGYIAEIFNKIAADTMEELWKHLRTGGVTNIFVVGGFSDLIATQCREELGSKYRVIGNRDTYGYILKGSVLYGQSVYSSCGKPLGKNVANAHVQPMDTNQV